jgi:hypothetical protein
MFYTLVVAAVMIRQKHKLVKSLNYTNRTSIIFHTLYSSQTDTLKLTKDSLFTNIIFDYEVVASQYKNPFTVFTSQAMACKCVT